MQYTSLSVLYTYQGTASNTKPVADAGSNISASEGKKVYLDGSDSYDPDGDDITYSWSVENENSDDGILGMVDQVTVTLYNTTSVSPYFIAPTLEDGTTSQSFVFNLEVTDEAGLTDTDSVTVTVTQSTTDSGEPQAVANANKTSVGPGEQVTLDGSDSTDDGTIQSYEWEQTSGTDVTIENNTSAEASFTTPTVVEKSQENLVFQLTITDDDGNVDTDTVTIVLLANGGTITDPDDSDGDGNLEPVADAGTYDVVYSGQVVYLDGSGSYDADGTIEGYGWYQIGASGTMADIPEALRVQLSGTYTASAYFTAPAVEEEQTLMFQLTVLDDDGEADSAVCTLTVMPSETVNLYFPHVQADESWESEIGIINNDSVNTLSGQLIAYDNDGSQVGSSITIALPAMGRKELLVGETFTDPDSIAYLVYQSNSHAVKGYTRIYVNDTAAAAFAAVPASDVPSGDIYIPHMTSNTDDWTTTLGLLNTASTDATLQIAFNTGDIKSIDIKAGEHKAVLVKDLFDGTVPESLRAGVIQGAAGIVGVEIFKWDNLMAATLLKSKLASHMVFPHVPNDDQWVTGLAAYNLSAYTAVVTLIPYSADGAVLEPKALTIGPWNTMVKLTSTIGISEDAAWIDMLSTSEVSGLSLFANLVESNYAGFETIGNTGTSGIFPRVEHSGSDVGIALINTEYETATVTLKAYDNDGEMLAETEISLAGHAKLLNTSDVIFGTTDITGATYFTYSSDKVLSGVQVTLSEDQQMGDALPGL